MGLVIATILIAYISAITFSNQAFAQVHIVMPGKNITTRVGEALGQTNTKVTDSVTQANVKVLGQEAQVEKVLAGHLRGGHSLGDVCLSCWGG